MALPILDACRKRKRQPKLFEFHKFAEPCNPISPTGPFRDNIRVFLRNCAVLEDQNIQGNPTWCTLLFHETKSFVVPLYTIEEDVRHSQQPFCDHCRCSGWNNNFVSKRKYHMIIPADRQWNEPLEDDVFDLNTHLLHGLIHCNGFGHLICINGIEGGSRYLCGREIMDLWDRICSNLRARKITVEDLSKKRSMDLRLLYGVAYGHSWFGRWGYKFCQGSFGVTEQNYDRAIEILSSLELDRIIEDFGNTTQCREIKKIVCHYRDISETHLTAINDILRFMLTVKSCAPNQKFARVTCSTSFSSDKPLKNTVLHKKPQEKLVKSKRFSKVIAKLDSRWPARRLQSAAEVIVEALKEKKADKYSAGGMTRQDVRDAARMHIGDTGLLDYVLKSMNNVIVGNYVVRRAVNPITRVLEYTIHELNNGVWVSEPESAMEISSELLPNPSMEPGADVYRDIAFLYRIVLLNSPKSELVGLACRVILDSKRFVKEWPFRDEPELIFTFSCQLLPSLLDSEAKLARRLPPPEIVMVPLHATVFDLKKAVEIAFRDTYCSLEKFVVGEIEDLEEMGDTEVLFGAVESGGELCVRGTGIDSETQLMYEGGDDNWKVRCECGARDDDGEAMVACDICEVWQHTRCCGIVDAETVPPLFICPGCCDSLIQTRAKHCNDEFDSCDDLLLTTEANYREEDVQFFDNNVGMLLGSVSIL